MHEDIYVQMLRFGKSKLLDGFRLQELVDYLNNLSGQNSYSRNSNILTQYFNVVYFSNDDATTYPPNNGQIFYIRPECYMQLLEHDNMLQARKESKEARVYAIVAIVVSVITGVVSLFK
jgi:hypothetical protein